MHPFLHTFYPSSDEEEALFIHLAQVPWAQPAFLIQSLPGLVLHVEEAHEDISAPETHLPGSVGINIGQFERAAWNNFTTAIITKTKY